MRKRWVWIGAALLVAALVVIGATALLTPGQTHPAYAAAVAFAEAAGKGDDETAFALLAPDVQAFVRAECPDGSVSACVDAYTPPEWGEMVSVVFRRAAPDTSATRDGQIAAYDVDLIATYAEDVGFSGVCIYTRMAQDDAGAWRVARYAGWVSCGDAASRSMAGNPDAPNSAP